MLQDNSNNMFLALLAFYPELLFQNQSFPLLSDLKVFFFSSSSFGFEAKRKKLLKQNSRSKYRDSLQFGRISKQTKGEHTLVLKSMLIRMKYLFWFQYCFPKQCNFPSDNDFECSFTMWSVFLLFEKRTFVHREVSAFHKFPLLLF